MFEVFSNGYYLGRLFVEPHDGDRAAMHSRQHERVNEQLYATGAGVERTDYPLVMKLDTAHLRVHGSENVPADTLVVPRDRLERSRVENPPALREVLLAKAEHAERLVRTGAV